MANTDMTKRSQDEIVAQIRSHREDDMLGFEIEEYVPYLDFAHAKEFLKPEITERKWMRNVKTVKPPAEAIKAYMPFAWGKANGCRGISANCSIEHMIAWLWLDGKDWLRKEYDENYEYYGKPQLVKICEEYNIDWKSLDDGEWRNSEDEKSITAEEALRR